MANVVRISPAAPPRRRPKADKQKRSRAKLTDATVAALKPNERVYDTMLPGFFVERGPAENSVPSFRVLKDVPAALRKWNMPKTMFRTVPEEHSGSAKAARAAARDMIAMIHKGIDPSGDAAPVGGWTLDEAWNQYLADLRKQKLSPNTFYAYEKSYARLPEKWAARPLAEIGVDGLGLRRLHIEITELSGETSADATLALLGAVYNHARGTFTAWPEWPKRAVTPHGTRNRSKEGMSLDQLPAWWKECQRLKEPIKREMMLFTLLSGCRYNDVRTALREHLNETERKLFIPAPKGHRPDNIKHDRAFWLPVTEPMMACIKRTEALWLASKRKPSRVLFPSKHSKSQMFGESSSAQYTGEDGKVRQPKRGHTLRHTFKNIARAVGVSHAASETLLNHSLGGPQYGDAAVAPLAERAAMEKISDAVAKALGL